MLPVPPPFPPPPKATIAYPVTVHSEEDYRQMEKSGGADELDDGRNFFCRTFYDVRLKRSAQVASVI